MPLPCSPVSHSAPSSETQSSSFHSSEETDDSLTTPRAGPSDPAQRTHANLSRPSLPPPVGDSPENSFREPSNGKESRRSSGSSGRKDESVGPGIGGAKNASTVKSAGTEKRDSPFETQTEGHPSEPYVRASPPRRPKPTFSSDKPPLPERNSSVSFTAQTSQPKAERHGSYSSLAMSRRTPNASPHTVARRSCEDAESSADEGTAIFRRAAPRGYGGTGADGTQTREREDEGGAGYEGAAEEDSPRRRKAASVKNRSQAGSITNTAGGDAQQRSSQEQERVAEEHDDTWWKRVVDKYGSVELENKGSVARDHLALERTFLAWLRTSLAFASIGVAVTQLFRLNTSLQNAEGGEVDTSSSLSLFELLVSNAEPQHKLRHVGKPLGATFLGISILILLLGFHRYFESQHYVIRGKFPASRGSIVLVSLVTFALIVASLVVVVAVAPAAFER